jgi:mono/diheme cytochrome c family protein
MEETMTLRMIAKALILSLVAMLATTGGNCLAEQVVDIVDGKRLYDEYCASCHGEKGIGQDPKRRGGGLDENKIPLAPALNGTAHTWHHSPSYLFKYIKKGSIVGNSPMPSFGDELNKQEILSIISYFQSLWPEKKLEWYFKKYKNE